MNDQHAKGTINETKGKIREEIGHATGHDKQTIKGIAEQVVGKVQKGLGNLKDAVKEKVDDIMEKHPSKKSA